jgi:cilia- and flagella-associated protein 43
VEKVSNRKEFLLKDYQMKMTQDTKSLSTLRKGIHEKEQESQQLLNTITQLTADVQQSENIKYSKVQASGGEGLASAVALKKMKRVVQRSKLVDLARVQAEEIEILRQELDRMRQRTFPSFVK